jgi:hypothetical protein
VRYGGDGNGYSRRPHGERERDVLCVLLSRPSLSPVCGDIGPGDERTALSLKLSAWFNVDVAL